VIFAERAQAARLPIFYASGTNTEKPAETPLPVRRGYFVILCVAQRDLVASVRIGLAWQRPAAALRFNSCHRAPI
jgi:hypothetical protein